MMNFLKSEMNRELEKSLVNLKFFRKIKCITHVVELDELFPKIGVLNLKTACGRCIFKLIGNASRDLQVTKIFSVIFELCVGATSPTTGFEVSERDFRKVLVELCNMYNTLFYKKISNLPK